MTQTRKLLKVYLKEICMAHGASELLDLYIRRQKIGLEFKFEKEIKLRQILVKVERFWNEQCTF